MDTSSTRISSAEKCPQHPLPAGRGRGHESEVTETPQPLALSCLGGCWQLCATVQVAGWSCPTLAGKSFHLQGLKTFRASAGQGRACAERRVLRAASLGQQLPRPRLAEGRVRIQSPDRRGLEGARRAAGPSPVSCGRGVRLSRSALFWVSAAGSSSPLSGQFVCVCHASPGDAAFGSQEGFLLP